MIFARTIIHAVCDPYSIGFRMIVSCWTGRRQDDMKEESIPQVRRGRTARAGACYLVPKGI